MEALHSACSLCNCKCNPKIKAPTYNQVISQRSQVSNLLSKSQKLRKIKAMSFSPFVRWSGSNEIEIPITQFRSNRLLGQCLSKKITVIYQYRPTLRDGVKRKFVRVPFQTRDRFVAYHFLCILCPHHNMRFTIVLRVFVSIVLIARECNRGPTNIK